MAKTKTQYACQNCGANSPKWIGKCPYCGEWNTYVEEVVTKTSNKVPGLVSGTGSKPMLLGDIKTNDETRIDTGNAELNRVLGGGLVPGSITLIGGEPGIGKSTLVLQVALDIADKKVLYVSGEESMQQIKLRAERLHRGGRPCYFLSETLLENILNQIKQLEPDLVIIDSIQTVATDRVESSPGSVAQIRECTTSILKLAKEASLPVLLIGHINKEGSLAGPKVLEHIVDTVLQFEGDRNYMYRILRSTKNRFGSTSELGIFEMNQEGLREVTNPSELLLSQHSDELSGTAISAAVEGLRPFLIEIQALVSSAAYGTPQRSATGFDLRRMNMLLAVLEKRAGFKLMSKDVFLNIAGGLKVNDPAIDLAVLCAILSSNFDIAINKRFCFAGEVGLTGEIRPINRIEQRIGEAEKLGFSEIFIPKFNSGIQQQKYKIKVHQVTRVEEVFKRVFS
ncbi:DNA repair protein RadA [Puteibacter caeruleilacunae]|nr:DNA repair protein RadA [Puteibacter caeruleilacunae]